MQTFLPRINRKQIQHLQRQRGKALENSLYNIFRNNVGLLDKKRLGKQRVEAFQLINAISQQKRNARKISRWIHAPAAQLWVNDVETLKIYMNACIDEWKEQGYKNNMKQADINTDSISIPTWLGEAKIHQSHRENLIRKDKNFYAPLFPQDQPGDEYIWYNSREGYWSKNTRKKNNTEKKKRSSSSTLSATRKRKSSSMEGNDEEMENTNSISGFDEKNENIRTYKTRRITRSMVKHQSLDEYK